MKSIISLNFSRKCFNISKISRHFRYKHNGATTTDFGFKEVKSQDKEGMVNRQLYNKLSFTHIFIYIDHYLRFTV